MRPIIHTLSFTAVGLVACAQSLAQENFDQAGASWNPTIYTDRWPRGGVFWRSPFAGVPCLPASQLNPIAQGGDKEGAYMHPGAQACEAFALVDVIAAHNVADTRTAGFIHLCPNPGSNSRATAGFVARGSGFPGAPPGPNQSYMAVLSAPPGSNDVYVLLIRDLDGCLDNAPADGIIDAGDILNVAGPIGTTAFNYHLQFQVAGNTLDAQARRVFVAGGALVADPPVTISAVDNAIASGINGVVASAAWGNRVFWDDVNINVAAGGGPDGDRIGEPGSDCLCDWTNDRTINSQDFFEYLSSFFAASPDADLNGDDRVNSQDFFEFLTCFFSGCGN